MLPRDYIYIWWKQQVGNTDFWTNLAPMWFCTYEYMKSTLQNFLFQFQTELPDWIFQIWPKILKSDPVLVYMKKLLFWAFFGPAMVNRPLVIPKEGAWSRKTATNLIGGSGWPLMDRMNFWLVFFPELLEISFCSSANPVLAF